MGRSRSSWALLSAALLCLATSAAVVASACGSSLPAPPYGSHSGDEPVLVPYPPPAAKPELIPPNKLGENAVWIDGEWRSQGGEWLWQAGRWEVPYPGAYYARPKGVRRPDGQLAWYHGVWHSSSDANRPPSPSPTERPVNPPSPRSSTGVPLPTLPPGSERIDSADAGADANADTDAGTNAGADAGTNAGANAGTNAGANASADAGAP